MKFISTVLSILCFCNFVYSQSRISTFVNIDTKSGLTHNAVTTILQDSKGFMWFGTQGGLNKYDGYKITQYRTETGTENTLSSNSIATLYEDSKGIIWIGTLGGGLVKFNPLTGEFSKNRYSLQNPSSAVFDDVTGIHEDDNGALWLATDKGLIKFDRKNNLFRKYKGKSDISDINTIHQGASGAFWLGTSQGLAKFDQKLKKFILYRTDLEIAPKRSPLNVFTVLEDHRGMVWMGTQGGGLNRFNPNTGKISNFKNNPNDISSLSSNVVYDIKEFEKGKLWIATSYGISILDTSTEKFERIINDPNNPTSLSHNDVHYLYKDDNQVLWVGTLGGGVNKTDLHKKKFRLLQKNPLNKNSLANNNVFAIEEDHLGQVWIGTIDGGLDKYDPKSKRFTHYYPNIRDPKSLSSWDILSLHTGPSGNLWIGTDIGGISMVPSNNLSKPPGKINFIKYQEGPQPNKISFNVVYSILEDRQGTVWAGTWTRGLNKIQFNNKVDGEIDYTRPTITHIKPTGMDTISISHDIVFTLYEDRKGTLWVGTGGGGLNKRIELKENVNGKTEKRDVFVKYLNHPSDPTSLSDNFVSRIYEARNGDFWIGTATGLNKMNRKTGKFKAYTTAQGLPNNVIFGILEDRKGNLWLGTHGGISRFNPKTEKFRNYSVDDGIQGGLFNPDAYLLSRTGEMYFGGQNGVTVFFPDSILDNPYKPEIMITDFKVFNKEGKSTLQNDNLKNTISTYKQVELRHEDHIFSVEFSSSAYSIPQKNQFAYKLEGFNRNWVYTDANNRIATYTNLDHGEYELKIKASNADGVWNDNELSIKITVLPPFWKTIWFRILILILSLGILFLIYSWRVYAIEEQKRELETIVSKRTKEIVQQKEEILSQRNEIEGLYSELKDSIKAARVLQNSILPSEEIIKKYFPHSFILNKPKDVVSGDFFWCGEKDGKIIIALVDCTGHGISGAFMSIHGHHLLNEAIFPYENLVASEILDRLNDTLIKDLGKNFEESLSLDGMDIALCIFEKDKKEVQFAGANNPLYILRNDKIIQVKPNRISIGIRFTGKTKKYTNQNIALEEGDQLYLFSDGYPDQLGGRNGDKFMYNQFRELLIKIGDEVFSRQSEILEQTFVSWKGNMEQLDDVMIIGLKP